MARLPFPPTAIFYDNHRVLTHQLKSPWPKEKKNSPWPFELTQVGGSGTTTVGQLEEACEKWVDGSSPSSKWDLLVITASLANQAVAYAVKHSDFKKRFLLTASELSLIGP